MTTMQRFSVFLVLLLACAILQEQPAKAFTHSSIGRPATKCVESAYSFLCSSPSSGDTWEHGPDLERTTTQLPTIDFRVFLTQRTVQSFMFLLSQTRDMYTIRWLDNFTRPVLPQVGGADLKFNDNTSLSVDPFLGEAGKGGLMTPGSRLLMYHGIDALNATLFPKWDSYFTQLLDRPGTVLEISSGNPGTPFRTFDIDIDPPRLCARLLSVRSQIAKEWVDDLGFLARMTSDRVFSSYWQNVKENKTAGFDREGLWFLEYINSEESDYSPNPLRKGSFDLLKLLATQESVHRVLSHKSPFVNDGEEKDMDGDDAVGSIVSKAFLRMFYLERLDSHFRGYGGYGRADDFIEELMLCPPRLVTSAVGQDSNTEVSGLVDPLRLAEAVMKERETVAIDWKELASQSLGDHVEIQKMQLDKIHQRPADEKVATKPPDEFRDNRPIAADGGSSWQ